jgi:long-chain acyl-CoA synthetase
MLADASRDFPETPYVWNKGDDGWSPLTFPQVRDAARELAAGLRAHGFRAGQTAAILAEGRQEWVVSEFASLCAGGISVPLSIKLLPEEIPFRINHSEAQFLVVSKNTAARVASVMDQFDNAVRLIYLDDDSQVPEELEEEYGIVDGKHLIRYTELMRVGRENFASHSEELDRIEAETEEDSVATISYTSGTTGNPKGIMLTHLNYYVNCHDSVSIFRVPYGYKTLLILPCDHSFAHTVGLYAALLRGISLYFVDARGGSMAMLRNISSNLTETNPTFLLTVPALSGNFMKRIREAVRAKGSLASRLFDLGLRNGRRYHGDGYHRPGFLKRLVSAIPYRIVDRLVFRNVRASFGRDIQFCVGGGALLDIEQQRFFKSIGIPIYQGYGLTEAAPVISSNTPYGHKIGTSGKVAPSVDCRIVRDDGSEASQGEVGQITVRGENVMKGYYKNPDATAEAIRDGWLFTGDRGFLDADGFLQVVGREKALLIGSDGEKYSPEEIEEAILNSSELISQVLVYNDHKPYTTALITVEPDTVRSYIEQKQLKSADELLDALAGAIRAFTRNPSYRDRFPERWLPSTFQVLPEQFSEENHLINSSMKMVRYKIVERYKDRIETMYGPDGQDHKNPDNRAVVTQLFGLQ